jgi:hypothetical protein
MFCQHMCCTRPSGKGFSDIVTVSNPSALWVANLIDSVTPPLAKDDVLFFGVT